jgi:hypothetical protein
MAPVGRGARSDAGGSPVYQYGKSRQPVDNTVPSAKSEPAGKKADFLDRVQWELSHALPGNSPLDSLNAFGPGVGAVGRIIGRGAGALMSAARKGITAGRAEAAANNVMRAAKARADQAREMNMAKDAAAREAADTVRVARRAPRSLEEETMAGEGNPHFKRGGAVKKMAFGGSVSSASKRADGIATKGKTKGRYL